MRRRSRQFETDRLGDRRLRKAEQLAAATYELRSDACIVTGVTSRRELKGHMTVVCKLLGNCEMRLSCLIFYLKSEPKKFPPA